MANAYVFVDPFVGLPKHLRHVPLPAQSKLDRLIRRFAGVTVTDEVVMEALRSAEHLLTPAIVDGFAKTFQLREEYDGLKPTLKWVYAHFILNEAKTDTVAFDVLTNAVNAATLHLQRLCDTEIVCPPIDGCVFNIMFL